MARHKKASRRHGGRAKHSDPQDPPPPRQTSSRPSPVETEAVATEGAAEAIASPVESEVYSSIASPEADELDEDLATAAESLAVATEGRPGTNNDEGVPSSSSGATPRSEQPESEGQSPGVNLAARSELITPSGSTAPAPGNADDPERGGTASSRVSRGSGLEPLLDLSETEERIANEEHERLQVAKSHLESLRCRLVRVKSLAESHASVPELDREAANTSKSLLDEFRSLHHLILAAKKEVKQIRDQARQRRAARKRAVEQAADRALRVRHLSRKALQDPVGLHAKPLSEAQIRAAIEKRAQRRCEDARMAKELHDKTSERSDVAARDGMKKLDGIIKYLDKELSQKRPPELFREVQVMVPLSPPVSPTGNVPWRSPSPSPNRADTLSVSQAKPKPVRGARLGIAGNPRGSVTANLPRSVNKLGSGALLSLLEPVRTTRRKVGERASNPRARARKAKHKDQGADAKAS